MIKRLVLIGALLWGVLPHLFSDPVDIEIDRRGDRFNLGLSKFQVAGKAAAGNSSELIQTTLKNDLDFSQYFNVVEGGPEIKGKNGLSDWATIGSELVLGGRLNAKAATNFEIEANLYDTKALKEVYSTKRTNETGNLRQLAHEIANDIVFYVSGQPGIFASKIAYVNDSTGRKELYISSYDGRDIFRLSNDNSIVILPRISPNGKNIIFTSYRSGNPDLYIMDVDGRNRKKVSSQAGLNVAPSWAPNSQEFAITLSIHDSPNIYLMDLNGKVLRRITDGKGAETAPSFSPDGSQLAFTSDRYGQPHIFVMNIDGTGLRRITTDGHCDSAAWSPDGKTIAYVKGKRGEKFNIYSVEVLTGIERRLTWNEGDNENPAWSPDSRSILFVSTRLGKEELFVMNADGGNQRSLVSYKGNSFTPHWSN